MSVRQVLRIAVLVLVVAAFAVSSALAGADTTAHKMTSTLDGRHTLPTRVHWIARPGISSAKVAEVDFLIDGRLAWVEHKPPYVYGDDGNWLVTSFLKPGMHTFTTRAITIATKRIRPDIVKALVVAPAAPPAELAGSWTRAVSADDMKKCTSGSCAPAGTWGLTVSAKGWAMRDPDGGAGLFDVAYLAGGALQMRPTIEFPTYPNANNGGFCSDTDPLSVWTGTPSSDGKTLRLDPAQADPCGDRAAILQGTWIRSS
jgi:hypothetical protein